MLSMLYVSDIFISYFVIIWWALCSSLAYKGQSNFKKILAVKSACECQALFLKVFPAIETQTPMPHNIFLIPDFVKFLWLIFADSCIHTMWLPPYISFVHMEALYFTMHWLWCKISHEQFPLPNELVNWFSCPI